jgi:hypothetical protein
MAQALGNNFDQSAANNLHIFEDASKFSETVAQQEIVHDYAIRNQISLFKTSDTHPNSAKDNIAIEHENAEDNEDIAEGNHQVEDQLNVAASPSDTDVIKKRLCNWKVVIEMLKKKAPGIEWHKSKELSFKILNTETFAEEFSKYRTKNMLYQNITRGFRY